MTRKTKPFDCVEMKRKAQEELLARYEERKDEFASYWQFLQAECQESAWCRELRDRFQVEQREPQLK